MTVLSTIYSSEKLITARRLMKYVLLFVSVAFLTPQLTHAESDTGNSSSYTQSSANSVMSSLDMKKIGVWIDKGKYDKANKRLNKFAKKDDKNPDVWNLLGFSYRKQGKHEQSAEAYAIALKLNPEHKGALEYQGELFLALGDTEAAKGNLSALKGLCPTGCHELEVLQKAIDAAG